MPYDYNNIVREAARIYHFPEWLIYAIIEAESGGDPLAVSPVGAKGLMQLMPATAKEVSVVEPFDPLQNIMGGCRYLARIRTWLANSDFMIPLILAAYNAGIGTVRKYEGVPPFQETQKYVEKIMKHKP